MLASSADSSLEFYREKFGFAEIWRGGPKDGELRRIQVQVPGERGDAVELLLYGDMPAELVVTGPDGTLERRQVR